MPPGIGEDVPGCRGAAPGNQEAQVIGNRWESMAMSVDIMPSSLPNIRYANHFDTGRNSPDGRDYYSAPYICLPFKKD